MKGFILTELIIVIGIISIFASLVLTGYSNLERFFLTRSAKNEALTIMDRSRNLAIAMYQNDGWSFRVEDNKFMIYKGNNFDNRDQNFDEIYELPKKVSATTTSDIYFEPVTGKTIMSTTSINIASTTINITVSNNGIIK